MDRNGSVESQDPVGFNRPDTALAVRSSMEAVAQVKYEMEAIVAQSRAYPRDELKALERMLTAAKRPGFAAEARYSFPRGGQNVEGGSISLARPLAAYWGYIRSGWRIIADDEDYTHLQGFAHDVQTGAIRTQEDRAKKSIQRKNKKTGVTEWVRPDERDLRELLGRRGAILERNCVFAIIPPDIVESVLDACRKTLIDHENGNLRDSREDTIRKLVLAFSEIGVTKEMIETDLGHPIETVDAPELARLRAVFKSIRDGNTTIGSHFDQGQAPAKPETPSMRVDLSKARAGVAQDPPGGAPIGRPASAGGDPLSESYWHRDIEVFPASFPEGWAGGRVASKGPLAGMSFAQVAASTDPKVVAAVDALIEQGADAQREHGKAPMEAQQLAAALRSGRRTEVA